MKAADAAGKTAMIAIGFTAMALQTRRWLLIPAVAFFVGSGLISWDGAHNGELFGGLWFVTMAGTGLALKLGARLDVP